jgi:hypothetical protein
MIEAFHPSELSIPTEITDAMSLHVAAGALIRKSLSIDGEIIKPALLKRLIGQQVIVKNNDSGYSPNTKSGFAAIPAKKDFLNQMGGDLAKLWNDIDENEGNALEIFIQHARFTTLLPVTTISIYEPKDTINEPNEAEEDVSTYMRALGDGFGLKFETSIKKRKREINGIWAIQLTNELVRFANQAVEESLAIYSNLAQ